LDDGSFCAVMTLSGISGARERATASIRVRSPRKGAWDEIENLVRDKVGGTVVCTEKTEPVSIDEGDPVIADFRARMQAKWPERKIRLAHAGGATDARHLQALNLPMLVIGVDASGAHTPSERVIWASMDEHAELIGSFLKKRYAK
ncbi:MAG: M20/M25/M40 family metallo-hydrolase, partial [Kiritimatiellae bacterium]|nr:M20/M25/M40 family metallo-hydrolase [Kiritimatiellia bacterium]